MYPSEEEHGFSSEPFADRNNFENCVVSELKLKWVKGRLKQSARPTLSLRVLFPPSRT